MYKEVKKEGAERKKKEVERLRIMNFGNNEIIIIKIVYISRYERGMRMTRSNFYEVDAEEVQIAKIERDARVNATMSQWESTPESETRSAKK